MTTPITPTWLGEGGDNGSVGLGSNFESHWFCGMMQQEVVAKERKAAEECELPNRT